MHPVIDVLLLLSEKEKPSPDIEILHLEEEAEAHGFAYFLTTRYVDRFLTPGKSVVALYGDSTRRHRLLATGVFAGFLDWATQTSQFEGLTKGHIFYREDRPRTAVGLIKLTDVHRYCEEPDLAELAGVLDTGERLTSAEISRLDNQAYETTSVLGTKISSLYFVRNPTGQPTAEETVLMLRAKKHELEQKVGQFRDKWEQSVEYRKVIGDDLKKTAETVSELVEWFGSGNEAAAFAAKMINMKTNKLLPMFQLAAAITLSKQDPKLFQWLLIEQDHIALCCPKVLEERCRCSDNPSARTMDTDEGILKLRIWQAQCVTGLQRVDQIRRWYIKVHHELWTVPHYDKLSRKNIEVKEALEIRSLWEQIRGRDNVMYKQLDFLRRMRNNICHMKLISCEDMVKLNQFDFLS